MKEEIIKILEHYQFDPARGFDSEERHIEDDDFENIANKIIELINKNDYIADVSNCTLSKECLDKWMWKYAKEVQDADNIIGLHVDTNFRGWLADNLMNEYYC